MPVGAPADSEGRSGMRVTSVNMAHRGYEYAVEGLGAS